MSKENLTPTPEEIKAHRISLGLNRAQYAKLLGVSHAAVRCWEYGQYTPSPSMSKVLTDFMGEHQGNGRTPSPEEIKAHRLSLGLSQAQYAKRIGVSGRAVGHWESGRYIPTPSSCKVLADLMDEHHTSDEHIPSPEEIRAHRLSLGLSQTQYAKQIGVSQPVLSYWECGRRTPLSPQLERLRRIMGSTDTQPSLDDYTANQTIQPEQPAPMTNHTSNIIPQAAANPQAITIDWQALIDTHQGVKGVSLRHLVSLGLYGDYRRAAEALERDPVIFDMTSKITLAADGAGRPGSDYIITDLRTVQRFCARARTEMGARIMDVILDHHDELQAMLAGDAAAQERHEQAKAPQATDPLAAIRMMLDQMEAQRDAAAALEARQRQIEQDAAAFAQVVSDQDARLAQVEVQLNTTPIAGHMSAYQIAQRGGYVSSSDRPHESAVAAVGYELRLEDEGESYVVMAEHNGHMCPTRRYTPVGAAMILTRMKALAEAAGDAPFFNVVTNTKTFTVYKQR